MLFFFGIILQMNVYVTGDPYMIRYSKITITKLESSVKALDFTRCFIKNFRGQKYLFTYFMR